MVARPGPVAGRDNPGLRTPNSCASVSLGLYIHIPFCASKCPYCDFASVAGKEHLSSRYVDAVVREILGRAGRASPGRVRFDSIYFGGGTPTSLAASEVERILNAVASTAGWASGAEITVEANPARSDAEKFEDLRRLGVNRLSIGLQSFDDGELRFLGRAHTSEEGVRAYTLGREAGFDNVNLDLIFAIPGQTEAVWQSHLNRMIQLGPEHASVYNLTIEQGTEFGRLHRLGRMSLPPEATQGTLYRMAIESLTGAGYRHYEISNFARPGHPSSHNLGYWNGSEYLGVGVSAHSFLNGQRSWNARGLTDYIERIECGGTATVGQEMLSPAERRSEGILLGLRWVDEGVEAAPLLKDPGTRRRLGRLIERDLLERVNGRMRLTRKGLMVADAVILEVVSA